MIKDYTYLIFDFPTGVGYITTKTLREILKELDNKLTDEDLDEIIADIDQEKSGKIDFEHFKALMI